MNSEPSCDGSALAMSFEALSSQVAAILTAASPQLTLYLVSHWIAIGSHTRMKISSSTLYSASRHGTVGPIRGRLATVTKMRCILSLGGHCRSTHVTECHGALYQVHRGLRGLRDQRMKTAPPPKLVLFMV